MLQARKPNRLQPFEGLYKYHQISGEKIQSHTHQSTNRFNMFGTHLRAIKPMASFRRKENNPQLNRLGALQIVFLPGVAEELLQKCLAAREEFFGPDHPDTMRLI